MITSRDKERARAAVTNAIRAGKLARGKCEQDDSGVCKGRIEGHHDDYSRPLDVRWLCLRHHRRFHEDHPVSGGATETGTAKRSRTVRLSVSIPDALGEVLLARAAAEERPVSNMVARLLRVGMEIHDAARAQRR